MNQLIECDDCGLEFVDCELSGIGICDDCICLPDPREPVPTKIYERLGQRPAILVEFASEQDAVCYCNLYDGDIIYSPSPHRPGYRVEFTGGKLDNYRRPGVPFFRVTPVNYR